MTSSIVALSSTGAVATSLPEGVDTAIVVNVPECAFAKPLVEG
jgi:hypothetical protein